MTGKKTLAKNTAILIKVQVKPHTKDVLCSLCKLQVPCNFLNLHIKGQIGGSPPYLNNLWIKLTTNRLDKQQNKSTLTLLFTEAMSVARSYLDVCLSNDTTVFTSKYMYKPSMLFSPRKSLPTNSSFGLNTYITSENRKLQQENFHLLIKQIKKLTQ